VDAAYTKGYEHLLDSIHEHVPGVRITLLGPSPFDEVTRPAHFAGGYNGVMAHFADLDRALAQKVGGTFINLNPPVVAALEKAQAIDPLMAKTLLPDRVHPDPLAHWVMAETLLKGWNAPALVSSVSMDGGTGKLLDAQNATVSEVQQGADGLRWTETEDGLPLAFTKANETQALLLQISDIQQELNQEPLRVIGLADGRYKLTIDGSLVGTFSALELTKGVNLADYATPMWRQAQEVSWMVRDRDEAHYIHLRMAVRGFTPGTPDAMDAFENSLEDSIYAKAAPKAHVYLLSLVTP
jgi:hypothetical protein